MSNPFDFSGQGGGNDNMGGVGPMLNMIMKAMAQAPCEEVCKWIIQGIQLAYASKNVDKVVEDMRELTSDSSDVEAIMAKYAMRPPPSRDDVDIFVTEAMKHIDNMVFEGRPMPTGPTPDNPLGVPYEMSDMASFMRVFARWLNSYMKLEGEQ